MPCESISGSESPRHSSRRLVILDDLPHSLLVCSTIFLEEVVRLRLCGRLRVHFVEQHLNAEEDLFDGDGGLPGFFFVENRQADGAGRVDVRVEERWGEFA